MKILFSKEAFNQAKSRAPLPLQCYNCQRTFYKPKNVIQKYLSKNASNVSNKFCSRECQHESKSTLQNIQCDNCHQIFQKPLHRIKRCKHNFCNQSCAAVYCNSHKTYGYRRSKIEIWIEKSLAKLYPHLNILYNDIKTVGKELDIYIPSLSLAFELNGILHYKPIYGLKKLSKIQLNDQSKSQKCIGNNIELCIIDISSLEHFKEQKAQKHLDTITSLIQSKLQPLIF